MFTLMAFKIWLVLVFKFKLISTNEDNVLLWPGDDVKYEDQLRETPFRIPDIGYKMCWKYCQYHPNCQALSYDVTDLSCRLQYDGREFLHLDKRTTCSRDCGYESICLLTRRGKEVCVVVACVEDQDLPVPTLWPVGTIRSNTRFIQACRGNGEFQNLDNNIDWDTVHDVAESSEDYYPDMPIDD